MANATVHGVSRAYSGNLPNTASGSPAETSLWAYTVPEDADYAVIRRITGFIAPVSDVTLGFSMGWAVVDANGNWRKLRYHYPSNAGAYRTVDQELSIVLRPGEGVLSRCTSRQASAKDFAQGIYLDQVGGTVPGNIATDTFAGSASTSLAVHAADTGQSWTIDNGSVILNGNGGAVPAVSAAFGRAKLVGTNGTGYRVRGTIVPNATNNTRLIACFTDGSNLISGGIDAGNAGRANLTFTTGGTLTQASDTSLNAVNGTAYEVELRVIMGQYISLFIDGVCRDRKSVV